MRGAACSLADASPATADDHWLVVLLLVMDRGRAELARFASTFAVRSELLLLEIMSARFRFALTSERWVEALHALTKQAIDSAHHGGPVNVAFHATAEAHS